MKYPSSKECWMRAMDSGVRSQQAINLQSAKDDSRLLKTERRVPCYINLEQPDGKEKAKRYYRDQMNPAESRSRSGGAGAWVNIDYQPFYSLIVRMEREQPLLAAVGHVLCHPDDSGCSRNIDTVVEETLFRFALSTPRFGDKRAWSTKKMAQLDGLFRAAWYEQRINVSGKNEPWGCIQIADFANHWFGCEVKTKDWHRDWAEHWDRITGIVEQLDNDAMAPIANLRRDLHKKYGKAA